MNLPARRCCLSSLPIVCLGALILTALVACNKGGRYEDDDDNNSPVPGYSVAGTVGVADNTAVDSDINDQGALRVDNNNFAQAQVLPVPVVLGGYVNVANSGAVGLSFTRGDPSDFYWIRLDSGQTIDLRFSDYPGSSIQLFLYDEERRLIDASLGDGNTQSLTVAAAGGYYLEVSADFGASNYSLIINLAAFDTLSNATSATHKGASLKLGDDFIPGEVIVEMDAGLSTADHGLFATLSPLGLDADTATGPQLIRFDVGGSDTPLVRSFSDNPDSERRSLIDPTDSELLAKWDTLQTIKALRAQPGVRTADFNHRRHAFGISPDDQYYDLQWHYSLINLPNAWEQTTGSADVIVAVIDTGVLLDHPDLQGQLVAGYDFISDTAISRDNDGRDNDPADPGDSLDGNSSFHGTHVAGTIAAITDNGSGVAGAGWQTRVMPLRVLGVGGGTSDDLIQALRYAAGLSNASGTTPARPADIINLSLGGEGYSEAEQETLAAVREAGVIIVAAAGNSADDRVHYPAGYEGVVSVAAVDSQGGRAPYSSFGATVDIAAPGGDTASDHDGDGYLDGVLSTCGEEVFGTFRTINNIYCFQQGTSMATPHVAAVAALMMAVDPNMTPADFDARLIDGELTKEMGEAGWHEEFGYGLVDAYKAVLNATENAPTVALFEPAALTFGRTDSTLQLITTRVGSDPLSILSVSSDADWLSIDGETLDVDGFGGYAVNVDRTDLVDGIYSASLGFETSTGIQAVSVKMQVLADTEPGDITNHYILLVDSNSYQVAAQAEAIEGTGEYILSEVSAGTYFLIAGTDMDNDGKVGDSGEAFGAYLSLDDPVMLAISGNLSGLDLQTAFRLALPGTLPSGGGYPVLKAGMKDR